MRSHTPPPPLLSRRTWCHPPRSPAPATPPPLFAKQRDLVVLSLLLRPDPD